MPFKMITTAETFMRIITSTMLFITAMVMVMVMEMDMEKKKTLKALMMDMEMAIRAIDRSIVPTTIRGIRRSTARMIRLVIIMRVIEIFVFVFFFIFRFYFVLLILYSVFGL